MVGLLFRVVFRGRRVSLGVCDVVGDVDGDVDGADPGGWSIARDCVEDVEPAGTPGGQNARGETGEHADDGDDRQ
jgi:hypothetical protein